MQVIVSHRRDWRARCARLAVVGALCTGLAGAVHAAEFNEKLRAPAMQDAAGVQTRVQSMTARFEQRLFYLRAVCERMDYDIEWLLPKVGYQPLGNARHRIVAHVLVAFVR